MHKGDFQVVIKANTWNRDSHGLFDYESRNIHKRTLQTNKSCKIIRLNHEILLIPENQQVPENAKVLALVKERQQDPKKGCTFTVNVPENTEGADRFWIVARFLKQSNGTRGYIIKKNDVFKLGRVKFKVKEISNDNAQKAEVQSEKMVLEALQPCRFCLNEEYSQQNPMITPCSCDGTAKYIHMNCLQKWIRSKCIEKQTAVTNSYYWKSLDCEICKTPYSTVLSNQLKNGNLIELDKPNSDYLILETTQKDGAYKIIHMVSMQNKQQVVLGRGHDSDVRISDISVSRSHAMISSLQKNQFFLEDNNSKFGTLIQSKKPIKLSEQNSISIQIGRTVIHFALKKVQQNSIQVLSLTPETTIQGQTAVQEQIQKIEEKESSEEEFFNYEEKNQSYQL